jgi:hypothetical protein
MMLNQGEIDEVVDLASSMNTTHVTVDTPLEFPSVTGQWANRIHADGKHVWFRLSSIDCNQPHGDLGDGSPSYQRGYLTRLHNFILANPGLFKSGDILDGDPEAENSCWWAAHYGCGVQSTCTPCNNTASNAPCAPVPQFIEFLTKMTDQENADLASLGITGVITQVHSTDPGTATQVLTPAFVRAMGDLITVDAYPDQDTSDPASAAQSWKDALASWHQAWLNRGIDVSILVGEWGYSNTISVDDATQSAVVHAETTQAFANVPYLVGTNYWVGPGYPGDGGYTQIFTSDATGWHLRPAATDVSEFYASKAPAAPPPTSSTTTTSTVITPGTTSTTTTTTATSPQAPPPRPKAPVLASLRIMPSAFRATPHASAGVSARYGSHISFHTDRTAVITFTVLRVRTGVVRRKSCVAAPATGPPRGAKPCEYTTALGSFPRAGRSGVTRFGFTGWVKGRALDPGAYRLRAQARAGKLSSAPVQTRFQVRGR